MLIDACMTNCTSWFQPSAWFILCMLFIKHQILSFHINPPMSNLWLPHGLGYKSCCAPEREIRQYIYIIKYYRSEIIPRWTVICGSDSSGEWTAPASGVKLLLLWGVSHRGSEQHLLLEWIHSTGVIHQRSEQHLFVEWNHSSVFAVWLPRLWFHEISPSLLSVYFWLHFV